MHPSIVFSSFRASKSSSTSSSSSKINAIEQFAGIICLWSCLTTILWWLVFDQFQPAVIMVDPLKIFWVLTNSTYLGMSVCLWIYALHLGHTISFHFFFLGSVSVSFIYYRPFIAFVLSSVNNIPGLCTLFDWFAHSSNIVRCHCCGKKRKKKCQW